MTYRERREARADRLRGWAEKREAKATADYDAGRTIADGIPFGQPILVGHHSEGRARRDQDRIQSAMRRSVESSDMAGRMSSRAATIESQLEQSIYSDDDDAVERLTERVAALEAERDRIKAYNASCRKGSRDLALLTDVERADLVSVAKYAPYQLGKGGAFPAYKLSNLNGNLNRNRKRLEALQQKGVTS